MNRQQKNQVLAALLFTTSLLSTVFIANGFFTQTPEALTIGKLESREMASVANVDPNQDAINGDGLKYFGFFASAQDGVGIGNYTEELRDFTNISWVAGGDMPSKILQAHNDQMKSIVTIYGAFYPNNQFGALPAAGSPDEQILINNWKTLAASLKPYEDDIAALYIMDEPYEKGIPTADLERIISIVKQDFPRTPTAMIVQPDDLKHDGWMPAHMDWAGFDCYQGKCDNVTNYNRLKAGLKPGQRSFVVPIAFQEGKVKISDIFAQASQMYNICRFDSACIAVIPFLWQTTTQKKKTLVGARDLFDVSALYKRYGQEITGKNRPATPAPWPAASASAHPVYRFFNSSHAEHFLTITKSEGDILHYGYEGISFYLYDAPIDGSHPIYRCFAPGMHFLSTQPDCEGGKAHQEGVMGYASDEERVGTRPLYRVFLPGTRDHLSSTNPEEGLRHGYLLDGLMGYVAPSPRPQ